MDVKKEHSNKTLFLQYGYSFKSQNKTLKGVLHSNRAAKCVKLTKKIFYRITTLSNIILGIFLSKHMYKHTKKYVLRFISKIK